MALNDDIIHRLIEMLLELRPSMKAELALQIEKQLRFEFMGERIYVKKPKRSPEEITQRLNGQNVKQVAKDLGISHATVYRAIKWRRDLLDG